MRHNDTTEPVSRRSVLGSGALVAGIGLAGFTGAAAARPPVNGGMGMIASSVLADYGNSEPFTIVERFAASNPWAPTDIDVACDDETDVVSFWPYRIVDENGGSTRYLFFPSDKDVKLGNSLHTFHNVEEHCSDVGDGRHWVKVRVKPSRG